MVKKAFRTTKNLLHFGLALNATLLNGFPSRKMVVIGVTGTDGKTTTASLIYHILIHSGKKVALISTLGAKINKEEHETGFHVTTPSPYQVQKYIKMAKENGCTHLVIEVTSHALDQNRVSGIKFNIGVLTNITHEHLDYHSSFKNYADTKIKLLKKSDVAVVNSGGDWFPYVKEALPENKMRTYSLAGADKNDTTSLNLPFNITTGLLGNFNLENILAAIVVARELSVEDKVIARAIACFEAPTGRQQVIKTEKVGLLMIDFAHTPNSFERLLPDIKKRTKGRLIHVFGCAGKRDRSKRKVMGKVASMYDNVIILTSEDSRGEDIFDINKEIISGIDESFEIGDKNDTQDGKVLHQIPDRREAIEFALTLAKKDDSVLLTGKGHERSINNGNGDVPWSDEEVVEKYLNNI